MNTSGASKKTTIPSEIIKQFETELEGIQHGTGKLELVFRDGRLQRFVINRETSHLTLTN